MSQEVKIKKIFLSNYRNHKRLKITTDKKIVLLFGSNGSGKTNILEAISLISSKTGFRNVRLCSLPNNIQELDTNNFGIHFHLSSQSETYNIGIGLEKKSGKFKKIFKFNGEKVKSGDFKNKVRVFWVLPTMINLFCGPASDRRDFLDSMISSFDEIYNKTLVSYIKFQKERIRILKKFNLSKSNEQWLLSIEKKMSSLGVIICDSRRLFIEKLNEHSHKSKGQIPLIKTSLNGEIDKKLLSNPALKVEECFLKKLKTNRQIDMITGRTNFGINKTDLKVYDKKKLEYSENCSTGEQKVLLLSILFLYVQILKERKFYKIICLLDDIFSYLDKKFINIVLEELVNLNIQTWISNVNDEFIDKESKYYKEIMFLNIEDI